MPVETSSELFQELKSLDGIVESSTANLSVLSSQDSNALAIQRVVDLGQMSRGFVHDFRNVLAVISAGLNLAKRHSSDPVLAEGFLTGAQEGVDRGLKMTMRLLEFARGNDCEIQTGNVNEALRQSEALLRYAAGGDIKVVLQLGADVPDFDFDPPRFNAAIMNLVVNARDAMPDGGAIEISTDCITLATLPSADQEAYVRVRVRDNGEGMSANVLRRICDPFFTTKTGTGTGLGIPQVQTFVEQAGGFMKIDSEVGAGSIIELLFPAPSGPLAVHIER